MVARYDIEQGSEKWHEIKHGKIGGSRAKQLFVNSDTLLIELLSEICEDFDLKDSYQNYDMQRGMELEPEARVYLSKYLDVNLIECGWIQDSENSLLGISPDGITECETISAEIKCFASKRHVDVLLKNDIPKENIAQCLQYFLVNTKLETHYFISYRPENIYKIAFIKELKRDSLVDIGFTKKVKVKEDRGLGIKEYTETTWDLRTVDEWCILMREQADFLQKEIIIQTNHLKF